MYKTKLVLAVVALICLPWTAYRFGFGPIFGHWKLSLNSVVTSVPTPPTPSPTTKVTLINISPGSIFTHHQHIGHHSLFFFLSESHDNSVVTSVSTPPPTPSPTFDPKRWTTHHQHIGFTWTRHAEQWRDLVAGRLEFADDERCGNYPPGTWTGKNMDDLPNLDKPPGVFPGLELYGSRRAQWELYKHQHPQSCKGKRYMIVQALGPSEAHGIGSAIHITTAYLLYGFWSNRIILSEPQADTIWMQGSFCKGHKTWDSCYFLPLSNCTLDDIGITNFSKIPRLTIPQMFDLQLNSSASWRVTYGFSSRECREKLLFLPDFAKQFMQFSNLKSETYYYWWRAQGAAYLLRPNNRTRQALRELRKVIFPQLTIPPGTVNVHVRRGDKWREARLPDNSEYFRLLQRMVSTYPQHLQKRVFLSTESANTVEYFKTQNGWNVTYVQARRYDEQGRSPMEHARRVGADVEMLNSLLNLELALECDGWICLLESNWCRMIDELRSAVRW